MSEQWNASSGPPALRVKKVAGSTTTVYIFSGAKVIAEYQNGAAPSSPKYQYVYAGGALLARIDSSGTFYYHQDHLSNRIETNASGGVVAQMGHFPFGESWYNAAGTKWLFTTYERDAESGNDYAMARYHVSRLGRLSSPDPIAGSTANPQSLNRYSYSINDPANVTDPSGALPGCSNTVEAQPKNNSQQTSAKSGGGPSDTDADTDSNDANDDLAQQSGCGSHVNPFGGGGLSLDGGFASDDSGDMPNGGFPIGGGDLASQIQMMNVPANPIYEAVLNLGDGGGIGIRLVSYDPGILFYTSSPTSPYGGDAENGNFDYYKNLRKQDNCQKGLDEANKKLDSLDRAIENWNTIQSAADASGIPPEMLAAVGVRESGFQNISQGGGQGAGVFQIDLGRNPSVTAQQASNLAWSANFAANMLGSNMNALAGKFPNFNSTQLLQATAASYNIGRGGISGNPATIDYGTAPGTKQHPELGNYGSDILLLIDCF